MYKPSGPAITNTESSPVEINRLRQTGRETRGPTSGHETRRGSNNIIKGRDGKRTERRQPRARILRNVRKPNSCSNSRRRAGRPPHGSCSIVDKTWSGRVPEIWKVRKTTVGTTTGTFPVGGVVGWPLTLTRRPELTNFVTNIRRETRRDDFV